MQCRGRHHASYDVSPDASPVFKLLDPSRLTVHPLQDRRFPTVSRLLVREGATAKMMGKVYLAVVQSVLLYGSETWVLSERMRGMLEGFHNRCARQMTRKFIRPDPENEGEWITPPVATTLAAAGLQPLMTYVKRRKATILVFAETRAIYRRCRRSTPIASNVNQLIWWQLANLA
jgi:hypothetical protein